MDEKQLIDCYYQEERDKLRWKVSQLELDSAEQRASDEVRKWRQRFGKSSSKQVERILNELEKSNQSEVSRLASELRASLDEFKETTLNRLSELDAFIAMMNFDDEVQCDHVKFELASINNKIQSIHIDIQVNVVNKATRRRLSTPIARNSLEFVKIFGFNKPKPPPTSFFDCLKPLTNFFNRLVAAGASYYPVGIFDRPKRW